VWVGWSRFQYKVNILFSCHAKPANNAVLIGII
jgi:hypothetical protein